jgi:ribosomal protein S18 acetylase RimI-like enzyme
MSEPECRETRREDLSAVARCHMRAFPDALSSRLGQRFTEKMLEWYASSDRGILFHLSAGDEVAGYCGGIRTLQPGLPGAFTSITQSAFFDFVFAFVCRPWLLFHPEIKPKWAGIVRNALIRARLKSAKSPVAAEARESFQPYWGLVVIGVAPSARRRGYGGLLLREFERRARAGGVPRIHLSVKRDNAAAIELYERNGWRVAETLRDTLVMKKSL